MKTNFILSFFSLLLVTLFTSCKTTDLARLSAKSNKEQMKTFVKTIKNQEPKVLDSVTFTSFSPTINFNLRKPNFVIIHHTAQDSIEQTLKTFHLQETQVSAHYVIGDDGEVVQMLNDYMRAWHAGSGKWGRTTDINSCSIGIELDNNGTEFFSVAQIKSLLVLLAHLKKEYNIPVENFIGHADIAPERKNDPSVCFPWKELAEKGFGIWPDEILETAPKNFDPIQALRIIGYDTKNLTAAVIAFKRHFIQSDITEAQNQVFINTIYSVFKKI